MHSTKTPERYFEVSPWHVVENGFDSKRQRLSESIFALANEYTCARGYFEEGYSGDHPQGSYIDQLFDNLINRYPTAGDRCITNDTATIDTFDWLYTRITLDGEQLDLARVAFSDFRRTLDMRTATLVREFIWTTATGKKLKLVFERFMNSAQPRMGCQRIRFEPLNFSGQIDIVSGLDFDIGYKIPGGFTRAEEGTAAKDGRTNRSFWTLEKTGKTGDVYAILARATGADISLFSSFKLNSSQEIKTTLVEDVATRFMGLAFALSLEQGEACSLEKIVVNHWARKEPGSDMLWGDGLELANTLSFTTYDHAHRSHCSLWRYSWENMDVEIEGDPETQQDMRYELFLVFMNTILQSSISPAVVTMLKPGIGRKDGAYGFLADASRLDLGSGNDPIRSIASSCLLESVILGLGGFHTQADVLSFAPRIPDKWESYRFRLHHRDSTLEVRVDKQHVSLKTLKGEPVEVLLYGSSEVVNACGIAVPLKQRMNSRSAASIYMRFS